MKLIIKRDQADVKGVFGGHKGMKFLLSYRIELTQEEQELITRYKAEHHPLTYRTDANGVQVPKETISSLMKGVTTEVQDITVLLNNESVIKEACKNFKTLLTVMSTFGGEEVVEF